MDVLELTKNLKDQDYTTSELRNLGISKYYINKLIDLSILTRISRGNYKCTLPKKTQSKEARAYFNKFVKSVLNREYDVSWEYLKKNFETKTINDYDNHLRIYFTLLNELLEEKKDLSFLDELCFFTSLEEDSEYFKDFVLFSESALCKDYKNALKYIKMFKENERDRLGFNNISTTIFYNLLVGISIKEKEKRNIHQEQVQPRQEVRRVEPSYTTLLNNFNYYFERDMYNESLRIINLLIDKAYPKYKDKYIKLKKLIETYLYMLENKVGLPSVDVDYGSSTDSKYIFNVALINKDYRTALKNIGKLVYLNPNSQTLLEYRKMIYLINELDKKYGSRKDEKVSTQKISIDPHDLYDLVYDGEHDKLYTLLDEYYNNPNHTDNRILFNLLKLLKYIKDLNENPNTYISNDIISKSENDYFGYFFEAMKLRNYREAYRVVSKCNEITQQRDSNDIEFLLYQYMLQDVVKEIDRFEADRKFYSKLKEYDTKIDEFIFSKVAMDEDRINELINLLQDKKSFALDNYCDLTIEEDRLLSLLLTIRNFKGHYGNLKDFFDVGSYEGTIVDKFNQSMDYGDYASALEFITDKEWLDKTKKMDNRKYFIIYKKLLWTLKTNVEVKASKKEELTIDEVVTDPRVRLIQKIKSLIKKNDYITAYILYLESDLDSTNPELKVYLDILLKYLVDYQREGSLEYLNKYKEAYRRGDMEAALKHLEEYKSSIANTGLDRTLDYHYDRIKREESLMNSPNFVLIENLYDRARYYFEQRQYENCIKVLDEYLTLDSGPRAYLLRGRAYEYLRNFDQAQKDYEAATNISKEPNALYRLGKLALYRSDYEGAYGYLTQHHERRPYLNLDAVRSLVLCEENLDSVEKRNHMKIYMALNQKKSN